MKPLEKNEHTSIKKKYIFPFFKKFIFKSTNFHINNVKLDAIEREKHFMRIVTCDCDM